MAAAGGEGEALAAKEGRRHQEPIRHRHEGSHKDQGGRAEEDVQCEVDGRASATLALRRSGSMGGNKEEVTGITFNASE